MIRCLAHVDFRKQASLALAPATDVLSQLPGVQEREVAEHLRERGGAVGVLAT